MEKANSDSSKNYPFEDAALKTAAQYFGEELLPYLGVRESLEYVAPTESVHLEVREMYQDFNYVMEDGSWLHLEFESDSIKTEDLRRFREYEATTSRTHKVEVNTWVICSSSVKNPLRKLESGMNTYRVRVIRLKDRNADKIFEKLFGKQEKGIPLKKKEKVQAVLTPLMSSELSEKDRILNICKILRREEENTDKDEMGKLQAVMYAFAVKFLTRVELEEVKEALKMTILGELIREDALLEGWKAGKEEGDLRRVVSQICKKMRKAQNAVQIADALEEDVSYIESICEVAQKYAPEYDEEKVCREILDLKKRNQ